MTNTTTLHRWQALGAFLAAVGLSACNPNFRVECDNGKVKSVESWVGMVNDPNIAAQQICADHAQPTSTPLPQ